MVLKFITKSLLPPEAHQFIALGRFGQVALSVGYFVGDIGFSLCLALFYQTMKKINVGKAEVTNQNGN